MRSRSASGSLYHFEEQYRKITIECGVKLAPTTDPDKAFSPCTAGVMLGIHFDTVAWVWSIPQEKLAWLLIQISNTIKASRLLQHELWSLTRRFLHYAPLVPGSRFYLNYIITTNATWKNKNCSFSVTPELARQLESWALLLRATSGLCSILDPVVPLAAWTIEAFTDAADVAAAIGCSVHVHKITRCSAVGRVMADALSKGNIPFCFNVARQYSWPLRPSPAVVPAPLLRLAGSAS